MAGIERDFLEMLPPRDHDPRYMGADHSMIRDFWQSTSDQESLQEMQDTGGRDGHSTMVPSLHHVPSFRPYGYSEPLHADSVVTMEARSNHQAAAAAVAAGSFFTEYRTYPLPDSHSTPSTLLPTYTNFFHASCVTDTPTNCRSHELKPDPSEGSRYMTTSPAEHHYGASHHGNHGEEHRYSDDRYNERYPDDEGYQASPLMPPVAAPMGHESGTFATTVASECTHRAQDMETLRMDLAYKCQRSGDLLNAITNTANAMVRRHGSATSGGSTDEDDAPEERCFSTSGMRSNMMFNLSEMLKSTAATFSSNIESFLAQERNPEHDQNLRAIIVEHPYYPEMVVAHIKIFKIGAPRELRNKLDDVTKKFQRLQQSSTMRIGDNPSLDFLMKSYVDLLSKFGEEIEEPFNNFMQFKDDTAKALEMICGHHIEIGPDESDNYGFDIGPIEGAQDNDEQEEGLMYPFGDVDESIVVDPSAPDVEIRKMLMLKYGRHIGGLKAEFNRVRKKGKLPSNARSILKDWFNQHSYWPYPSEGEKQYLQRICSLDLKQINNWFINERKRHWSCEGKCMHPNTKFCSNSNGEGKGHREHME